jgi:hypothetical protein
MQTASIPAAKPLSDNISQFDPSLRQAVDRYEHALTSNDLETLSGMFADNPDGIPVVRSDASGMLMGHAAITAFRTRRSGPPCVRSGDGLCVDWAPTAPAWSPNSIVRPVAWCSRPRCGCAFPMTTRRRNHLDRPGKSLRRI